MLKYFKVAIIALAIVAVGATANAAFNTNLTVGSTGADVSALQSWLISKGFTIPSISSGAAQPGYFGSQTKAAVVAYQASVGLPNTGFVGPLTRGILNGTSVPSTPVATGCPVGYTCTANPGTVTPVTPGTPGVISTPGIEGTLTVTLNSEPASGTTVREGQTKVAIIGAKLEASNSDIDVQRVRVNLGTLSSVYTKVYKTLYVTDDAGNVLTSVDISSGVPKDGSNYVATIGGFHYIVRKGEKRVLYIKADLYSSIKTADQVARTVQLDANSIRGVDGAGIDQTGPSSAISRSVTSAGAQIDNAALTVSLSATTPKLGEAIASENSDGGATDNDLDKLEVSRIDLQADKDSLKITNAVIAITKTGTGAATASTTAYLYDVTSGTEKLVGSATVITTAYSGNNLAPFNTLDYVIPADTKSKFVVKVDVRGADGTASNISASATSTSFTVENSGGTAVTPSGSATGNAQTVRNIGPIFTLVSKEISTAKESNSNGVSTSTLTAKFTIKIKAVGGIIMFGTAASTTGALVNGDVTHLQVYRNSAVVAQGAVSTTTSFTAPTTGVVTSGLTNSFTIADGGEIELPIIYSFKSRTNAGVDTSSFGQYAVNLQALSWVGPSGVASSTFMTGISEWRTGEITFP